MSSIKCEHGKQTRYCRICDGRGLCVHDIIKFDCRQCHPERFCSHNKKYSNCKKCKVKHRCKHRIIKMYCVRCNNYAVCQKGENMKRKTEDDDPDYIDPEVNENERKAEKVMVVIDLTKSDDGTELEDGIDKLLKEIEEANKSISILLSQ